MPVAAAPGVFYVFRDEAARESFMASRVAAPKVRLRDKLFEEHHASLQELMLFVTEHGRLSEQDEIIAGVDLANVFSSIKRAFQLVRRVTGSGQWDVIRAERRNDLLVYIPLGRFPRRPKLSSIPSFLQRDIKALFGTYRTACSEGDELLFAAGDMAKVDEACKAAQFGKLMPTALYVHAAGLTRLPGLLRVYEVCARVLTGEVEGTTIVKMRRDEPKISYLAYPTFTTDAHPALVRCLRVDLRSFHLKYLDFSESANPPILHRKDWLTPAMMIITSAEQQSEKSPTKMRVVWENTSASRKSCRYPSAPCGSRSMSTISAAIPDIISANAVVDPTKPAPTIAMRGTLGSSDGCVEIFCIGDSISGSLIDPIFSSRRRPSFGPASCKFLFSTGSTGPCNQRLGDGT
jgi:DNA phosphorothioation-associated putative methyltransferase